MSCSSSELSEPYGLTRGSCSPWVFVSPPCVRSRGENVSEAAGAVLVGLSGVRNGMSRTFAHVARALPGIVSLGSNRVESRLPRREDELDTASGIVIGILDKFESYTAISTGR